MAIDTEAYAARIAELYARQAAAGDSTYLRLHSATRGGILRQVEAAALYLPHIAGRVLDWGCRHAVDACLVRMHHGPGVELHGCDLASPSNLAIFHDFAGLRYQRVQPGSQIPYPDHYFGTVIADGVLEHVPNDFESLKELYRILEPNGLLVISCLPNALSYTEFLARLFRLPHHLRTYTMRTIRSMLLHSGFDVRCQRYLQMVPTLSGLTPLSSRGWVRKSCSALWPADRLLRHLWPLNRLSSNLFLMARKRKVISWSPRHAA